MTGVKLVEVEAELAHATDDAYLVISLFNGREKVWVPKSLAEYHGDGTFTMPEWLALQKGLI